MCNFIRNCQNVLPEWLFYFVSPSGIYESSKSFPSLPALDITSLVILAVPIGMQWYLTMVLISISLTSNEVEHHFMCLFVILGSSLVSGLFKLLPIFKNWLFLIAVFKVPYTFQDKSLVKYVIFKYFLLVSSLCLQQSKCFLIGMKSIYQFFILSTLLLMPMHGCGDFLLCFFLYVS